MPAPTIPAPAEPIIPTPENLLRVIPSEPDAQAVARRLDNWRASLQPVDAASDWLLQEAVSTTFRIEQIHREINLTQYNLWQRARTTWDLDRRIAAEELATKLPRNPSLVRLMLERTPQGCDWLLERWGALLAVLDTPRALNPNEQALALDMLGVSRSLREAPTPLDAPADVDPLTHARRIVMCEIERLGAQRRLVAPLDAFAQSAARDGARLEPNPDLTRLQQELAGCKRRLKWILARFDRERRQRVLEAERAREVGASLNPALHAAPAQSTPVERAESSSNRPIGPISSRLDRSAQRSAMRQPAAPAAVGAARERPVGEHTDGGSRESGLAVRPLRGEPGGRAQAAG